jgi:hypothetical protein
VRALGEDAEPPAASTAAITSSGIAAWVKPVPKWMAAAIAKVAASAAIAIPILLLGVRRRVDSCACDVEVMVSPGGSAWSLWIGLVVRLRR